MAFVSVILPNYNHACYLKQRIESILNQTFENFELIILDDYSSDESRDIIELYKEHSKVSRIIYNDKNSGSVYSQWEKGILLAEGEYIWIAESDDWASKDFLSELIPLIEKDESTGICFCASTWVDDQSLEGKDLSLYHHSFHKSGKEEIRTELVFRNTIQNASSALIRTTLAKKHLVGVNKFRSCGDWFFYINILSESNLIFIEKKLNYFRWYHNNTSNRAAQDGSWVKEGLKILAESKAARVTYSLKDLRRVYLYWRQQISNSSINSVSTKLFLYKSLMIFYFKCMLSKSGTS